MNSISIPTTTEIRKAALGANCVLQTAQEIKFLQTL